MNAKENRPDLARIEAIREALKTSAAAPSLAEATIEDISSSSWQRARLARARCPFCAELHVHGWPEGSEALERVAPCGNGSYVLTGGGQ